MFSKYQKLLDFIWFKNKSKEQRVANVLYVTETAQSFGNYGLKFLLVIYLVTHLGFSDPSAYQTYGAYLALIYGLPFIGGMISEKFIGPVHAIIWGCVLMSVGYFCFTLNHPSGIFIGLSIVACGNGFYRTCIYDLIGKCFPNDPSQTDNAYNVIVIGCNLGAFIGLLALGAIAEYISWKAAFISASTVSTLSTLFLIFMKPLFSAIDELKIRPVRKSTMLSNKQSALIMLVFLCVICAYIIRNYYLMDFVMLALVIIAGTMIFNIYMKSRREKRYRLAVLMILLAFFILFTTGFEQLGSSIELFIDRTVNEKILGFEIPTSWFIATNPIFYVALGPALSMLWLMLSRRKMPVNTALKFALSFIALTIAYFFFIIASKYLNAHGYAYGSIVIVAIFVLSIAEAIINPVSLSMITLLAPKRHSSFFMGTWFLAFACGNYLAGELAKRVSIPHAEPHLKTVSDYEGFFSQISFGSLIITACLILLMPYILPALKKDKNLKKEPVQL